MAAGASAENFGHSARKSGGGRTVSGRRSSCGCWMVYDIVQGQENRPTSYGSQKIGIRQKCSFRRWIYVQLGRCLYNKNFYIYNKNKNNTFNVYNKNKNFYKNKNKNFYVYNKNKNKNKNFCVYNKNKNFLRL